MIVPLRDLIEENYHTLHSPADYAKRLYLTPKTLGRIVRDQLGTTTTDLIRNRILIHAKWELLHTLRPVKEISRELGFRDELYFSRLFKKSTGYSPTFFRELHPILESWGRTNRDAPANQRPLARTETKS
jgi:AraC family transcriptional activator of pobA